MQASANLGGATAQVGHTSRIFSRDRNTNEVFASIQAHTVANPKLLVAYDWDALNEFYYEVSVFHEVELGRNLAAEVAGRISYKDNTWNNYEASLALKKTYKDFVYGPKILYSNGVRDSGSSEHWIGGFFASYKF